MGGCLCFGLIPGCCYSDFVELPFLTLRDLLKTRLKAIEHEINLLRIAIDVLADKNISYSEFDMLKLQVASLSEATHELEARINNLEQHNSAVRWVVRQFGTAVVVAIIAWLAGWLA
jgi:hypothetical protein